MVSVKSKDGTNQLSALLHTLPEILTHKVLLTHTEPATKNGKKCSEGDDVQTTQLHQNHDNHLPFKGKYCRNIYEDLAP
jgi:hypothetical protein